MPSVNSSVFSSIDYDQETKTLVMTFKHGKEYPIYNFPENVYKEWMAADSLGRYFNDNIKDKY